MPDTDSNDNFKSLSSVFWSESAWLDTRIGRYQLKELLGKGSMGRVFLAEDVILRRKIALKVISKSIREAHETGYLEQFVREAQAIAALSHPNIARIYDIVNEEGVMAIATEYIPGGSFEDYINQRGRSNSTEVCRIVAELAQGLGHAHKNGMMHCDVKPANIMLTQKKECRIVDFGASWVKQKKKLAIMDGKIIGTPYTIAPEMITGNEPSPWSDIYSLGIVLWWALAGHPPFYSKTRKELYRKHLEDPPPDLAAFRTDVPRSLVSITHRCLEKKPEDRWPSCEKIARRLRDVIDDLSGHKKTSDTKSNVKTRPFFKEHYALVAAMGLFLLVTILAGVTLVITLWIL